MFYFCPKEVRAQRFDIFTYKNKEKKKNVLVKKRFFAW